MGQGPYTIECQGHAVRIQFEPGCEVTPELIIHAMDRENELFEIKGRQTVWDFRGCTPSPNFGYDTMHRVVEYIETMYAEADTTNKTALLVDETIQYGLSRMFQMLMDGYPGQIGIFHREEQARHWLGQKLDPDMT
jgi:hypothetical protein